MKIQFTMEDGARQPQKTYSGDAGTDLFTSEKKHIFPGQITSIKTGVYLCLPPGIWMQIIARSSTMHKHGLQVIEAVIDNGYRGEMLVQVYNPTQAIVYIEKDIRLAQIIPHMIIDLGWQRVKELPRSDRGVHGFGSTGV